MKGRKGGTDIDAAIQRYLWSDFQQRNMPKGIERIRMTFTELERRTGLSRRTISYQLQAKGAAVSIKFIYAYAKAVGTKPDSFIKKMMNSLKNQGEIE